MNRRTFVFLAGTLGVRIARSTGAVLPLLRGDNENPTAQRPESIGLGSGISLIDYRMYPSHPGAIIGELVNETDTRIDTPVVSVTETQTSGFSWLSPVFPTMPPGGISPVFGPAPFDPETREAVPALRFDLCSPVEAGEFSAKEASYEYDLVRRSESIDPGWYKGEITVVNTGTKTLEYPALRGLVRDQGGRIAGLTRMIRLPRIPPQKSQDARLEVSSEEPLTPRANPFPLLGNDVYSVEPFLGAVGDIVLGGCSFGMPWSTDSPGG